MLSNRQKPAFQPAPDSYYTAYWIDGENIFTTAPPKEGTSLAEVEKTAEKAEENHEPLTAIGGTIRRTSTDVRLPELEEPEQPQWGINNRFVFEADRLSL